MKITHVQTTRDGVIGEDYLEIECHQIGFTNEVPLGKISVEVARELQLALSAKVGEIPY